MSIPPAPSRRYDVLVAVALGAVSLLVTTPRAFAYSFWQDEVGAARIITAPDLDGLLRGVVRTENHPPGYYTVGWMLHQLGAPVSWVRAISVLAVAFLTAGVVLYARRMLPLMAASVAGLVVALGWQFERHGWELRPYGLFAFLAFAAIWTLEWTADDPTLRRRLLLGCVVALGALVHVFFVFTLVAGFLWVILTRRSALYALLVPVGFGLLPLLAWTPGFVEQVRREHFATLPSFHTRGVVDVYAELILRSVPTGAGGLVLALAVLAGVIGGALRLLRDPRRGLLVALSTVVPVAIAALLWLAGPHIFQPRALIGVAPFAAVALAATLPRSSPLATAAAAVLAGSLLVFGFVRTDARIVPDYDLVADALVAEGWRPEDPILLFGSAYDYLHPLDWYLPGSDRLELSTAGPGRCPTMFIVAVGGQARALTAPLRPRLRRVDKVVIGSFPWRPSVWKDVRERDGHVLATRRSACSQPL